MKSSGKNISLTSYDDIFSTDSTRNQGQVELIRLNDLVPFKDHPFRVVDDDSMTELVEAIRSMGVVTPIIARPTEDGAFEIISGHRRKHACELLGIEEVPVLVKNLDDEDATIIMVDSNVQRKNILPSELAKAYQMKLDAIKRKAGRPAKENSSQVATNFRADQTIGDEAGVSKDTVRRFIRLNNLEQPLMDKVDNGELAFTPAVELSYLKPEEQGWLHAALEQTQQTPSLSQAQRMKKESKEGTLSEQGVLDIMSEEKKPLYNSVTLSHDTLKKYFPKSYTAKQMETVIIKLLDNWLKHRKMAKDK